MKISIFTTMTNPEKRMDPWKEALECYNFFADEVVVVGDDWPTEFSWDHIGKTFQKGYDKCTSDWVMRMDIDYFLHEKNKNKLEKDIRQFFELYRCDVDDRNLKLLSFFTDDPIVSSDVIGREETMVFDSKATMVTADNLLKTLCWYDNGWGFSKRILDSDDQSDQN